MEFQPDGSLYYPIAIDVATRIFFRIGADDVVQSQ